LQLWPGLRQVAANASRPSTPATKPPAPPAINVLSNPRRLEPAAMERANSSTRDPFIRAHHRLHRYVNIRRSEQRDS
jgi:hypothetical protein